LVLLFTYLKEAWSYGHKKFETEISIYTSIVGYPFLY